MLIKIRDPNTSQSGFPLFKLDELVNESDTLGSKVALSFKGNNTNVPV